MGPIQKLNGLPKQKFPQGEWDGVCLGCGKKVPDIPFRQKVRTCSHGCTTANQRKIAKEKFHKLNPRWADFGCPDLPTGTVGAINELRVASDLLLKGYSVFRAVSPACPCDLVLLCNGNVLRVEVTTCIVGPHGKTYHSKKNDKHKYDVLAVVKRDGEITYTPELPTLP